MPSRRTRRTKPAVPGFFRAKPLRADCGVVTLTFASWNQIAAGLRQLDRLGRFVGGRFQRMALMFGQKSSAGAAASLRRVSRKPHVVVCENRKNERL